MERLITVFVGIIMQFQVRISRRNPDKDNLFFDRVEPKVYTECPVGKHALSG